ncbi:diguanylate cyclase response regulator [Enterovibrio norvegicus FF-33]|uniref:diguanylate cyclase n=1 Tax=Enterovibrio norvegicus FF-454 TaxID=1185651 RepID=A0A1E5C364_9GAMM|nr:diguanylate cyclase [Enterovibrio norvegicus]OEE59949.1 diguanylate cyclase response regulator [Enterovibrio norvegicus FF-454]OEE69791.1 diguanylate cyclase response regulator [Enterovibrio norvegicus FF-33]OEE74137.1 diguanylate cyclase response regulator [Enterovibrio norvegicus FF-162]
MRPSQLKKFQEQQAKFAKGIGKRVERITTLWQTIQTNKTSTHGELDELVLEAHKLAGTATTLGFVDLGERGRDIEVLLKPSLEGQENPWPNTDMDALIATIDDVARIEPKRPEDLTYGEVTLLHEQGRTKQLVYVLADDLSNTQEMVEQLQYLEYDVLSFDATDDLKEALSKEAPSVLIVDINECDLLSKVTKVWRKNSGIPLVVLSSTECWKSRLLAAKAGAFAFFHKPIEYDDILSVLDSLWETHNAQYRVLIVEDEQILAEHYSIVLQGAGMKTLIVDDPEHLLDELGEFSPDLVLMDLYMPNCSGVEAASVIRQHSSHTNVPIVYLSGETDLKLQMKALQVGADDFLTKPINDLHLTQAVSIRAKRFRQLSALMDRDSLTGLLNHSNLKVALDRELSRARRHKSPLSFVMIDIDHFKSVNDRYGHPVGDKVIKGVARLLNYRFRKTDTCARYGGEEFALILPDTPADIALRLIDEFRITFAKTPFSNGPDTFYATLSAGVATFPEFDSIESIIEAADSSLYMAKEKGRNRVVTHVELDANKKNHA